MNNNLVDRLELSIQTYIGSHAKKFKSVFLCGDNLTEKIINQHKKYAPIKSDERVLMAVNKILLYPLFGMGIIITDRFLYYRLVNHNFKLMPLILMFKKKPVGIIPLSSIKQIKIGDDVMSLDGNYYGNEFIVNGQVLGLLPCAGFNRDGIAEELNQIFKAFDEN